MLVPCGVWTAGKLAGASPPWPGGRWALFHSGSSAATAASWMAGGCDRRSSGGVRSWLASCEQSAARAKLLAGFLAPSDRRPSVPV